MTIFGVIVFVHSWSFSLGHQSGSPHLKWQDASFQQPWQASLFCTRRHGISVHGSVKPEIITIGTLQHQASQESPELSPMNASASLMMSMRS